MIRCNVKSGNDLQHSNIEELAAAFNINLNLIIDPIMLATYLHKQAGLTISQAATLCKVSRTYIYKKLKEIK
jgi:hypothetical protein